MHPGEISDAVISVFEGFNYEHHSRLLSFTHRCLSQVPAKHTTRFVDLIYRAPGVESSISGPADGSEQIFINGPDDLFEFLKNGSPRYIIIHGQYRDDFWRGLLRRPRLWSKTIWIVWGGDLTSFVTPFLQRRLSHQLMRRPLLELCGRLMLPRLRWIGVLMPEDGKILQRCIPVADNIRRLFYPSDEVDLGPEPAERMDEKYLVICGNSGIGNNEHVGLIDIVRSIDNQATQWLFPLVYGPSDTIAAICGYGSCMLGKSFKPLRDLLSYRDFSRLFRQAHALVYNHRLDNRGQQGLGGICLAMRFGKKIYIRSDNPLFTQFKEWGAIVYDTLELNRLKSSEFYDPIDTNVAARNKEIVEKYFSEEAALSAWREALKPRARLLNRS